MLIWVKPFPVMQSWARRLSTGSLLVRRGSGAEGSWTTWFRLLSNLANFTSTDVGHAAQMIPVECMERTIRTMNVRSMPLDTKRQFVGSAYYTIIAANGNAS